MYEQNMKQIKRLQEGSIDYQYYAQRGRRRRNRLLRVWLRSLIAPAPIRAAGLKCAGRASRVTAQNRFRIAGFATTCR